MPIYEYVCEECGQQFDKLVRSIRQEPVEVACPACQKTQVRRLISSPAKLRSGEGGGQAKVEAPPANTPPVFGRKELNQALERKRQLKAEVGGS